jgi:DNA polymerase
VTKPPGLHLDFETRSAVELKKAGAYRYAEDPTTDVWCCCYARGDDPVKVWLPGDPFPDEMREQIDQGGQFIAHNYTFERAINLFVMRRHGWPVIPLELWDCTAVRAAAMALPRALDVVARVLRLPERKDNSGKLLMLKMARPVTTEPLTWFDKPEAIERLVAYCVQDVVVERSVDDYVRPLTEAEHGMMMLDSVINERGFRVDLEAVEAALTVIARAEGRLEAELAEVSGQAVRKLSDRAGFVSWLATEGVVAKSVDKEAVEKLLKGELRPAARRGLEIRQAANYTSIKKLQAMQASAGKDGRVRGSMMFLGASSTGRWSGNLCQPQNLPRGTGLVPPLDPVTGKPSGLIREIADAFPAIMTGDADTVEFMLGPAHRAISDCMRGFIVPSPGKRLVACDYSAIEAKITAIEAGQMDMVEVFLRGDDIYKYAAAQIYNVPYDKVTKAQRQVGKVACIAEGELVLTDRGEIPIQDIAIDDKVWDGSEWVSHDGVVLQGTGVVINHDGLNATPDHIVYTEDGRDISFGECAREQIGLATTGSGGRAIRYGGDNISRSYMARYDRSKRVPTKIPPHVDTMHRMWDDQINSIGQPSQRKNEGLSELFANDSSTLQMASQTYGCRVPTMHEFYESKLHGIRKKGDRIPIPVDSRSGVICVESTRLPKNGYSFFGNRSSRYQQTLRSGKFAIHNPTREYAQQKEHCFYDVQWGSHPSRRRHSCATNSSARLSIQSKHAKQPDSRRNDDRTDNTEISYVTKSQTKRVYDILNAGPRHRFTVSGKLVHNCLALGYQGGVGAFTNMAKAYRLDMSDAYESVLEVTPKDFQEMSLETFEENARAGRLDANLSKEAYLASDMVKRNWRARNRAIVKFWYDCEQAAAEAACDDQRRPYRVRNIVYVRKGPFLYCRLASGRVIVYPEPRIEPVKTRWGTIKESLTYTGPMKGKQGVWTRLSAYGGLLVENCLIYDTDVLTNAGWIPLRNVTQHHKVWDGIEWVSHDGVTHRGEQKVLDFCGVTMTPDHKVLTSSGWMAAEVCDSSAAVEIGRKAIRAMESSPPSSFEIGQEHVGMPVFLRSKNHKATPGQRTDQGNQPFLWLSSKRIGRQTEFDTSRVETSSLCSVASHARSMPFTDSSSLQKLWQTWHNCMSGMEYIRSFLGRYGFYISNWINFIAKKQQQRLLQKQLHMGDMGGAAQQQTQLCTRKNPSKRNDGSASFASIQRERDNYLLSNTTGMARRQAPVADILNAGPRHRFLVRGRMGELILVSNCVQATAASVLRDGLRNLEAAGYPIVMHIHDEAVVEVDPKEVDLKRIEILMTHMSPWMHAAKWPEGLITAAADGPLTRYRK